MLMCKLISNSNPIIYVTPICFIQLILKTKTSVAPDQRQTWIKWEPKTIIALWKSDRAFSQCPPLTEVTNIWTHMLEGTRELSSDI